MLALRRNNMISTRQMSVVFVACMFSPILRVMPVFAGEVAKQASWITPFVALPAFFALVWVMSRLFEKQKGKNLCHLFCEVYTKPVGYALCLVYFVWCATLAAVYTRYYSERLLSSLFTSSSSDLVIVVMLSFIYIAVRWGLTTYVRHSSLLVIMMLGGFAFTSVIAIISYCDITNLLPVSRLDILPVLGSVEYPLGIWGYYTLLYFLLDHVNHQNDLLRSGMRTWKFLLFTALAVVLVTVGSVGHYVVSRLTLPYFSIVRNLVAISPLERIEPFTVALWISGDYVIIALFIFIAVSIFRTVLQVNDHKAHVLPVIVIVYSLAFILARDETTLELFSSRIALPVNNVLSYIVPAVTLGVGKLRKVL